MPPWSDIFSADVHITSSRAWPMPDFVIYDNEKRISIAAEFKPPDQTKREYVTGLGQAVAYTLDFDYSLLVLPSTAHDTFPIAAHLTRVLRQPSLSAVPVGLLTYQPALISPASAEFIVEQMFGLRGEPPAVRAALETSFYAKWREQSPEEIGAYVKYLYQEKISPSSQEMSIRDRAFEHLFRDVQRGLLHHWGGAVRRYGEQTKEAVRKNYRNFVAHIGWIESDGTLTEAGLEAHRLSTFYGATSALFADYLAATLLLAGRHLVVLTQISQYQDGLSDTADGRALLDDEQRWLRGLEEYLEVKGLLKRNPARAEAARAGQERGFLKAEKQLWKNLGLILPRGRYVFHPGRGFICNWPRITDLVQRWQ
jgi:hypothetical protein